MPGPAFLSGERLTLHTVESEDHEFVHEHWNRPSNRRMTYWTRPLTMGTVAGFLDEREDSAEQFLPCRDGEPVGFVWLMDVDELSGHADVGYWIVEDERGNGYATEALDLAVEYAFVDRGLRKVLARVFEGNDASARVLEKVGFEREGRLREHYKVGGEYVDTDLFGLLKSEYEANE